MENPLRWMIIAFAAGFLVVILAWLAGTAGYQIAINQNRPINVYVHIDKEPPTLDRKP